MEPIKQLTGNWWARITLMFLGLFISAQSFAEKQGIDVDIHTKHSGTPWYATWYVWAAAALFILALVAIVSAGRRHS
jgi:hypothetical protein